MEGDFPAGCFTFHACIRSTADQTKMRMTFSFDWNSALRFVAQRGRSLYSATADSR